MGQRGVRLDTLEGSFRFAQYVSKSGFAPNWLKPPEQVLVAVQTGAEAGLTPLQSLRSIYMVGSTPSWLGDAARGLIVASGKCAEGGDPEVWTEGEGEKMVAFCRSERRTWKEPRTSEYSVSKAKQAGLWGKTGPWKSYPERMLGYRALGFHSRDYYSDVLMGLAIAEEVQDYERPAAPTGPAALINITPAAVEPITEPDALLEGAGTVGDIDLAASHPDPSPSVAGVEPKSGEDAVPLPSENSDAPGWEYGEPVPDEPEPKAKAKATKPKPEAKVARHELNGPLVSEGDRSKLWKAAVTRANHFAKSEMLDNDQVRDCALSLLDIVLKDKGYEPVDGVPTQISAADFKSLQGKLYNAKIPVAYIQSPPAIDPGPEDLEDLGDEPF